MQYTYTARDKTSKIIRGIIDAANEQSAITTLRKKDLFPIKVKSKQREIPFLQRKVPLKEKIIFTQQLEIMIRSGLSIVEALRALQVETGSKRFAAELTSIITDVEGGKTLSEAISKFPNTFNEIYVNIIRSGEKSGQLDKVLSRLKDQMEKEYELNRKIRGALAYPVFVLFALVGVLCLVLIFVIPQLTLIFDDAGVPLPILTQVIIKASNILRERGLLAASVLAFIFFLAAKWKKTVSGRRICDKLIVHIPVIGILLKKTYMSRFTRTFSALTSAGLPLLEVFKVAGGVVGNVIYKEEIDSMANKIKNGQSITKALKESKLFPGVIGQLASVGEKSGNLDEVFASLADFFDRDVDAITSNLSTLLEPILIAVMGAAVGVVIAAVLQPMYGLVNAV